MMKKKLFGVSKQTSGIVAGATVNLDAGNASSYSGSGTDWFDLSGNNYDATLVNGVGYDSGNGGVLTFDGLNDYVNGNSGYSINSAQYFTAEIWFNIDAIPNDFDVLFQIKNNGTDGYMCHLVPTANFAQYGTLTFGSRVLWTGRCKINTTINASTWYQVVIIFDGVNASSVGGYECYLNGTKQTILESSAFGATNNINYLGSQNGTSRYVDGKLPIFNLYNNKKFTQEEVTQNFDFYKGRFGFGTDADAQAFIDATGISDSQIETAINNLVVGLKADGLWTKMKAIYPFVGGTADTHKYNLKDPRDLDVAYRWTYVGSDPLTHSSNGIKANGVSTCNTHLKTTDLGLNSFTGTVYARDLNVTTNNSDFGDLPDSATFYLCIRYSGLSNATISNINQSGVNNFGGTSAGDVGLWSSSRIANNDLRVYRNGVQKAAKTTTTTSSSGGDIAFGGSSTSPCIKEFAFMSFGDGLNTTENANLYTLVQAFNTTLGRQV